LLAARVEHEARGARARRRTRASWRGFTKVAAAALAAVDARAEANQHREHARLGDAEALLEGKRSAPAIVIDA